MSALVRMFNYDYWANSRLLDVLINREVTDNKILHWTNHIINVEEMWLSRIQEEPTTISLKIQRPLTTLLQKTQQLHDAYHQIAELRTEEQLRETTVAYRNSRGMAFTVSLSDLLSHVINHSTHHRGQIVARLRELGYVPPVTDYLHFVQYAKV